MMKVWMALLLSLFLVLPVSAAEFSAPEVPEFGEDRMPQNTDSFGDALQELFRKSLRLLQPDLEEALQVSGCVISAVLLFSLLPLISDRIKTAASIAGVVTVAGILFQSADSMISLAAQEVQELTEYSKLLCPVLTTALAAQGGISSSTALYAGTTAVIAVLSNLISGILIPMVYSYLAFAVANSALADETLKKFADSIRGIINWLLKTLLIVFTTYMSVTGVVSGTTDAAALKAAKVTISTAVPVVGGILSDTSEAVLISMGIMKNAAGIYGILAVLAVFIGPFLKVGVHYLLLKMSSVLSGIMGNKQIAGLVDDFSAALGLLLAMTGTVCLLILISTVCFMRGGG